MDDVRIEGRRLRMRNMTIKCGVLGQRPELGRSMFQNSSQFHIIMDVHITFQTGISKLGEPIQ